MYLQCFNSPNAVAFYEPKVAKQLRPSNKSYQTRKSRRTGDNSMIITVSRQLTGKKNPKHIALWIFAQGEVLIVSFPAI